MYKKELRNKAKTEARWIINKFYNLDLQHTFGKEKALGDAKDCSIIAVDLILEYQYDMIPKRIDLYWKIVKEEIIKFKF